MDAADMFHVDVVESTEPPNEALAGSWCRYVISNRSSRVVGRYRGTLAQTRRNAERLANSINERAQTNRSVWAARPQTRKKPDRKASAARG